MRKLVIAVLVLSLLLCGCNRRFSKSGRNNSKDEKDYGKVQTESSENDEDGFVGTYVGLHGSGITLFKNGTAEYYWKEWEDVETDDSWKFDNSRIIISSSSLGYDLYADIKGNNTSALTFKSDDSGWNDEIFVKVSDNTEKKDVDTYIALIEKELGTKIERSSEDAAAEGSDSEETDEAVETSGVPPELKEYLDSYEAYVDEYVEFMKKYYKNPSDLSLLTNYAGMLQKMSEFDDKLEKYDTDEMSKEDYNYYMEVTLRCSQKMLNVVAESK